MAENISIKRNVVASYASSVYAVLISVVMAPVYLSYMGKEAYGLIGFFTMMNAWFQLVDMGLTPTVIRETALFRGGQISIGRLRVFLRGLEIIFGVVSVAAALTVLFLSQTIAIRWLKVGNLPIADVQTSLVIMGAIVPVRWMGGLYRAVLVGFERMAWLAIFNCTLATLRFVGVLIVFALVGVNVTYFFLYQLAVSLVDLFGSLFLSRYLMRSSGGDRQAFSWKPLRGNTAFSLTVGFATITSVLLSQTDKLVLSKELPLGTFGIFSLAVAAANVINIAGTPMSQAVLPRLTKLFAEGRLAASFQLYRNATQTVSMIIYPGVAALVFFAEPIMYAWTGRADFAHEAAPILRLYAIGNGFAALNLFSYYIQYARGRLHLHFIGSTFLLILLIPAFVFGGIYYGGVGTGMAWAIANGIYFIFWVPLVHARFFSGQHLNWLIHDVLAVIGLPTVAGIISWMIPWPHQRGVLIAYLGMVGVLFLVTSIAGSSFGRATALRLVRRFIAPKWQRSPSE